MPKKLVIISTMNGFPWGGSEELWWRTALHAHAQGHVVNIVIFEKKVIHKKILDLKQLGIDVDFIGRLEMDIPPLWKRATWKMLNKPTRIAHLNRFSFIKKLSPDVLLLNQGGTIDITYINDLKDFISELQVPFSILNQHHIEFGTLSNWQKEILLDLYKNASKVFFVAYRNKEVLERQLTTKFLNAEIIKNPVNLSNQSIIEWPKQVIPCIAVVARLDINFKGQDILLQTLASDKWRNRQFKINFFGEGPDKEYILNLIQFYGFESKFFLKGHVENVADIWKNHHILILPSHSEGTPLSLIESQICGRPCMVTDVGDSARLIQNNITGWVAYAASVNALDEALERAWAQRAEWQKMGVLAHKDAKKFFDPNPGKTLFEKLIHE